MRRNIALLLAITILAPIQASATSDITWEDARPNTISGTLGGLELPLLQNSSGHSVTEKVSDLPTIVEVYTATWCTSCVFTEQKLEQAVADKDVLRINYHKHKFEPEDPFGSNNTEDRWEEIYGEASISFGGAPHLAPSTVFDGERIHIGTRAKSGSLQEDFSISMGIGSSHPFVGNITFSFSRSSEGYEFSWDAETMNSDCYEDCSTEIRTPWILFVEGIANFPEGSNGVGNYSHVLHDAVSLTNMAGSQLIDAPIVWDGDDLSAVLLIDWESHDEQEGANSGNPLPASGITIFLSTLMALVSTRASNSSPRAE